jgi:primosomal protein N'
VQVGGAVHLTRIAHVVPDVPTFAVDDGFAYEVPGTLADLAVGDIVRVPLGGRKVRGYVTAVADGTPERVLREVAARSGKQGVFTPDMLRSLRWIATHYVAPLATVLARCSPPNLPRAVPRARNRSIPSVTGSLADWGSEQVARGRTRPGFLLSGTPIGAVASAVAPVVAAGKNVIIAAPTVAEAHATAANLAGTFGDRVLIATSDESAAARTTAWTRISAATGTIVVGTREVALWGKADLGLAVVLDEGRRGYKSPQTPTYNVRDVLRRRSAIERFGLLLTGAVPTADVLASGVEILRFERRIWPLIEVVDRSGEAFGRGAVGDRARRAIAALGDDHTAFVLVPRRGGTYRCARCRELRRCPNCDAMLDRSGTCARCGSDFSACQHCGGTRFEALGGSVSRVVDDLRRVFGGRVGPAGSGRHIAVGTERDLVGLEPVDLVIVVDPDAGILAPNYRAGEDALRLLARAALAAKPGRGRKGLVQTSLPGDPIFDALKRGDPTTYMDDVLRQRAETGFPPIGELIALETDATDAAVPLNEAAGGSVLLGPAQEGDRERWLIQGRDLSAVRLRLRPAVQHLRDGGARVRVDADPVDL